MSRPSDPSDSGLSRRVTHPVLRSLAALSAAVSIFRPGTTMPGGSAPYAGAPLPGAVEARATNARRLRRSLWFSTVEGMFAEVVSACSAGSVLTGWALHLGANPLLVGALTALPFIAQLVQVPSAYLSAYLGHRRVAIVAVALSRQVLWPLALMPILPLDATAKQRLLVLVAAASAFLGVVGNNAWVSWMGDLVPRRIRGRYFGRRTALCTLAGSTASLLSGYVLDLARQAEVIGLAFSALALVAVISGAVTTWLMAQQHGIGAPEPARLDRAAIAAPLFDAMARPLLAYQLVWNAAVGLTGAYFALHMLQNLKMGFLLIALHSAGVALVRISIGPLWGRAIDRIGSRPVLIACSFGISLIPLYWLAARPDFLWPVLVDVVYSGALWSGHALASFNLPLSIAPQKGRSFYLAVFAMAGGLAYALAAFAGGTLVESLPQTFELFGRPLFNVHGLFALSFLGRLTAAVLSTRIVELGSRPVEALAMLLTKADARKSAGSARERVTGTR